MRSSLRSRIWDLSALSESALFETIRENLLNFKTSQERLFNCHLNINIDLDSLRAKFCEARDLLLAQLGELGPDGIALSFNGGKDCTAMLCVHMLALAYYCRKSQNLNFEELKIRALYVASDDTFRELTNFVSRIARDCGIDAFTERECMKESLGIFLQKNPNVKAILVGVRRSDPKGSALELIKHTDPGWPPVLRLHPLLNWSLTHVWQFLVGLQLPYCELYAEGYTSLGSKSATRPNPALLAADGSRYHHAIFLTDCNSERNGRV